MNNLNRERDTWKSASTSRQWILNIYIERSHWVDVTLTVAYCVVGELETRHLSHELGPKKVTKVAENWPNILL